MSAAVTLAARDGQALVEDLAASPFAVRGLTVSYQGKPALFSVDMTVAPGSMTAIVGPNGAGKSTLLKAALGIVPRVSGTVTLHGRPLDRARGEVAYVPQRASVDWDFPARVRDVALLSLIHI
jgi:manganese/zinc/iron transport system ATP- binding protein